MDTNRIDDRFEAVEGNLADTRDGIERHLRQLYSRLDAVEQELDEDGNNDPRVARLQRDIENLLGRIARLEEQIGEIQLDAFREELAQLRDRVDGLWNDLNTEIQTVRTQATNALDVAETARDRADYAHRRIDEGFDRDNSADRARVMFALIWGALAGLVSGIWYANQTRQPETWLAGWQAPWVWGALSGVVVFGLILAIAPNASEESDDSEEEESSTEDSSSSLWSRFRDSFREGRDRIRRRQTSDEQSEERTSRTTSAGARQ